MTGPGWRRTPRLKRARWEMSRFVATWVYSATTI
jgi:hypothetical protein